LARRLRPTILFLEDLDLFAKHRSNWVNPAVLGELLAQLDGLEQNDGLIVLATTNDLDAIEPALKDRPSRFDLVLEIPLPKTNERRAILTRHLEGVGLDEGLLDEAATVTEGLSGAQVREAAFLAVQDAVIRCTSGAGCDVMVERNDLHQAVDRMLGRREQRPILGFRSDAR